MNANKETVKRYVECFNDGDLNGVQGLFAPEALIYGVFGWGTVEEILPVWKDMIEGLAIRLQIKELVAEEDVVVARMVERGTSRAPCRGQPATGRSYELTAIEWFVLEDGLIIRRWAARDSASQARQLGWDQPAGVCLQPVE